MTTVRVQDLRAAKVCQHAKIWFDRHGHDWRDFVKNGIDAELFLQTEPTNEIVVRIYEAAKRRDP